MTRRCCSLMELFLLVALALFFWGGCGYHIQGNLSLPGGTQAVHVALFENHSSETAAEDIFTNAFIDAVLKKTGARVTAPGQATGFISGSIQSITIGSLTRSSDDDVLQGRVSAVLDVVMTDADGRELWVVKGYSGSEVYTASSSNITDEAAKQEAVAQIADRLGEKLVSALSDDW